jgi:hypothetical protein
MADQRRQTARDRQDGVKVDPRLVAQIVQHQHEVFGRQVAAGTGRERGSPEAPGRCIEPSHSDLDPSESVDERCAAGVVQV